MNSVLIDLTDGTNVTFTLRNKELPTQEPIKSILAINSIMKLSMPVPIITSTLCLSWLTQEEPMEFCLKDTLMMIFIELPLPSTLP